MPVRVIVRRRTKRRTMHRSCARTAPIRLGIDVKVRPAPHHVPRVALPRRHRDSARVPIARAD